MAEPERTLTGPGWYLAYDVYGDQLGDANQAAEALGYSLVDLSGWWDRDRERFAGLWRGGGDQGASEGMTWDRGIQLEKYQEMVGRSSSGDDGFRPVRQQFYPTPGGVHLAIIWRSSPTRWMARHDMSREEFDVEHTAARDAGLSIVDISGYEQDGEARFAAVWEEGGGVDHSEVVSLGQEYAAMAEEFAQLASRGYAPRHVTAFIAQEHWIYCSSIWEKRGQRRGRTRRREDIPAGRFATVATELAASGYSPTRLAGYGTPAGPRLGAIFENPDGDLTAFHGADPAELRLSVIEANAAATQKERNIRAERQKQLDAEARRRARHEAEQQRIADKQKRQAEAAAERARQLEKEERARREAEAKAVAAAEAARAASAPPGERVQDALDAALRSINDFVEGAVAAIVIGAARNQGLDASSAHSLARFVTPTDVARVRDKITSVVQSYGTAEFRAFALHLEDAWRLKAGPLRLDLEGAVTLLEISASARYDTAKLSLSAFFESVSARLRGSAGVGVDGLGKAWAGGSLSGPGASGGVLLGMDGAAAQIGVTYGRAEAMAGLELLGQSSQVGIGVSAGFELGLQLSATVSVRLGPLSAAVPNLPLAAATWAGSALADMVSDPARTVTRAVEDVAGAVGDVTRFFGDLAQGALSVGESVIEGIGSLLGHESRPDVPLATKSETGADGRTTRHYQDFEGSNRAWIFVGNAGIDVGKGFAARGANNGWVRAERGVHVIAAFFDVMRNAPYTLSVTRRTSAARVYAVIGVRDAPGLNARGPLLAEDARWVQSPEYRRTELTFTSTGTGRVLVYIGLIGSGEDAWCQLDDVQLTTTTVFID